MSLFAPPMAGSEVPIGVLLDYGGSVAPAGWFLCDGTAISRTVYADLFGVISTNFGPGDGLTTFNLPDCRLKSTIGVQAGTINLGQSTGSLNHIHSTPAHQHASGTHQHETNFTHIPSAGFPFEGIFGMTGFFGIGATPRPIEKVVRVVDGGTIGYNPAVPLSEPVDLTGPGIGNTSIDGASTSGASNPPVIGCNKIIKY